VTLCVALTTADGLVMGADSMTVVRDSAMVKTYANANKVFDILGLPIVVMTYGAGALGRRTIASLVDEWMQQRPAFEKGPYTVEQVARDVGEFVFERHRAHREFLQRHAEESQARALRASTDAERAAIELIEYNPEDWVTGLVIGGYQPKSVYPWLWTWEEPEGPGTGSGLQLARHHEGESGEHGPESGLNIRGDKHALDRLIKGYDRAFIDALREAGLLETGERFEAIATELRWNVVFEGMPIQDAADYVRFLLQVGVGFERFGEGTPKIGGELDIAIITRHVVHWFDRKALTKALAPRSMPGRIDSDPKGS